MMAPRRCEVCGLPLENQIRQYEFICQKCSDLLPAAPSSDTILNRFITNFPKDLVSISNFYSLFSFNEDKDYIKIIYSLKYAGFKRVGTEFGKELGKLILEKSGTDYSAIIPIPIHHARMRERGFNQSDVIAAGISTIINIPVNNKIIRRSKYTKTQTLLTKAERKTNVNDVFVPFNNHINIKGKYFLLIDDVLTTGSTINSCGNVLLEMGAKRIDCATLACA